MRTTNYRVALGWSYPGSEGYCCSERHTTEYLRDASYDAQVTVVKVTVVRID